MRMIAAHGSIVIQNQHLHQKLNLAGIQAPVPNKPCHRSLATMPIQHTPGSCHAARTKSNMQTQIQHSNAASPQRRRCNVHTLPAGRRASYRRQPAEDAQRLDEIRAREERKRLTMGERPGACAGRLGGQAIALHRHPHLIHTTWRNQLTACALSRTSARRFPQGHLNAGPAFGGCTGVVVRLGHLHAGQHVKLRFERLPAAGQIHEGVGAAVLSAATVTADIDTAAVAACRQQRCLQALPRRVHNHDVCARQQRRQDERVAGGADRVAQGRRLGRAGVDQPLPAHCKRRLRRRVDLHAVQRRRRDRKRARCRVGACTPSGLNITSRPGRTRAARRSSHVGPVSIGGGSALAAAGAPTGCLTPQRQPDGADTRVKLENMGMGWHMLPDAPQHPGERAVIGLHEGSRRDAHACATKILPCAGGAVQVRPAATAEHRVAASVSVQVGPHAVHQRRAVRACAAAAGAATPASVACPGGWRRAASVRPQHACKRRCGVKVRAARGVSVDDEHDLRGVEVRRCGGVSTAACACKAGGCFCMKGVGAKQPQ
eukprot:78376-Chlamydomonas_euryale.AAC.7